MTDHGAQRAPEIAAAQTALLHRFGSRWDIRRELAVGIFSAERRSLDGRHIRFITAHSAAELAVKLDAAEVAEP